MSATRDGKMWRCQFYYKDWQGVSHKKNKRGFKTKAEAEGGSIPAFLVSGAVFQRDLPAWPRLFLRPAN